MTETKKPARWIFIVNPVAGNGFAKSLIPEITKMISRYNIVADLVQTECCGHAEILSSRYFDLGYDHIIGVGGDGTFNEISRPLIGKQEVTTGLIPAGTGNDFIQILGFPDRFTPRDWDVFFQGNVIPMDAGSCNGKFFMNGMGLGFDAQVAAENYSAPGEVKKGGKHKYIWHILKTLLFYKEQKMILSGEKGRHEIDCFINTIGNGRRFAGGFLLTPQALANDGRLDVCSIKSLNLAQRLSILLKVPAGKHISDPKINYFQTESLEIEFPREVPYHLDGELFFSSNFSIKALPGVLPVIYNPYGKHFFKRYS